MRYYHRCHGKYIANALGVTVDDLLCDSLKESGNSFDRIANNILDDCNHGELQIITEMMLALKETLRNSDYTKSKRSKK